jgi:hypothetical protein
MSFRTSVGICASIGGLLALFIWHWLNNLVSLVRPEWYESEYLPLWVALGVFGVLAIWARLSTRQAVVTGLLVTVPPYGLYAGIAWFEYMYGDSVFPIGEYGRLTARVVVLAMSGGALNPLLSSAASMWRRSRRMG